MVAGSDREQAPIYDFGWWPEIVGLVLTITIVTFLITVADGVV